MSINPLGMILPGDSMATSHVLNNTANEGAVQDKSRFDWEHNELCTQYVAMQAAEFLVSAMEDNLEWYRMVSRNLWIHLM